MEGNKIDPRDLFKKMTEHIDIPEEIKEEDDAKLINFGSLPVMNYKLVTAIINLLIMKGITDLDEFSDVFIATSKAVDKAVNFVDSFNIEDFENLFDEFNPEDDEDDYTDL